jgi:hypothetical protein
MEIVRRIVDIIVDDSISEHLKTREINRTLGYQVLRAELNTYFSQNSIDDSIIRNTNWNNVFAQLARLIIHKPIVLQNSSRVPHIEANTIPRVEYNSYPVIWLGSQPGAQINLYLALVRTEDIFSETLILNHEENGTIILEAGLFWDAN